MFDVKGRAEGVQLSRLFSLTGQQGASVTGTANFNAQISGNLSESDFSGYQITFDGEGKNVIINGREAGTLALKGRTENKQLNVTLTTGFWERRNQSLRRLILPANDWNPTSKPRLTMPTSRPVLKMVLPETPVKLSGLATGTLKFGGNLLDEDGYFSAGGLQGVANFTQLSFRVEDVQLNASAPLIVRFSPREVTF